jgi:hypothetical protein
MRRLRASNPALWKQRGRLGGGTESGTEYVETGAKLGKIWTVAASAGSAATSRNQRFQPWLCREPFEVSPRKSRASGAEGYRFEPCRGYS